ncbi:MAG TPA: hypothetical protein VGM50_22070 [Gemmatimonadaceae bacterium]|jgi:hypothetical protein
MQQTVEAPTPEALADLVARCAQINRYTTQLTAVEEVRIAALAAGILTMRGVLDLPEIKSEKLPARQRRIAHWALMGHHLSDLATPAIKHLHGTLVLDEHEQVKILSSRTWRGVWRDITLWRDGVQGLAAHDLMQYLAALTAAAQDRAPDTARQLLVRGKSVAAAELLTTARPRMR